MAKDLTVSALLDVYGSALSEKQRSLCSHYYNDDLSFAEIAENEGITRQGVCDRIKRAETQLRAMEKSCRYCEKFAALRSLCDGARRGDRDSIREMIKTIESL